MYHLHIQTPYGEDVVCTEHADAGRAASTDVPIDHPNDGSDTCGRCFVCEGRSPGAAGPVHLPGVDAEYVYGGVRSVAQLSARVGEISAARLLALRSRIEARTFGDYSR